jgi:hypothetical protein
MVHILQSAEGRIEESFFKIVMNKFILKQFQKENKNMISTQFHFYYY